MAAQVAATPTGENLIRLATGVSLGGGAEVGMRASRSKATAGWEVGGRIASRSDMAVNWRPTSL